MIEPQGSPISIFRKLGAMLINGMLTGLYIGILGLLIILDSDALLPWGGILPELNSTLAFGGTIFLITLPFLSLLGFESWTGTNPGFMILGLRVQPSQTGRIGQLQILMRKLLIWAEWGLGILSLLWALIISPAFLILIVGLIFFNRGYFFKSQTYTLAERLTQTQIVSVHNTHSKAMFRPFLLLAGSELLCMCVLVPLTRISYTGKADHSHLRSNAMLTQTLVETYGVDWQEFPDSVNTLEKEAKTSSSHYWKEFTNPYPQSGILFQNQKKGKALLNVSDPAEPGAVVYQPLQNPQGKITGYRIFVYDHRGKRLQLPHNGQMIPFELSNS